MTKDAFNQKTTWITRITLNKPFEVYDKTPMSVLIAPDGFTIRSKLLPDNDHKELYEHVGINYTQEVINRIVNSQSTKINGVKVKIVSKGMELEFRSPSAIKAAENCDALKAYLVGAGFETNEHTERCEKDSCKVSRG